MSGSIGNRFHIIGFLGGGDAELIGTEHTRARAFHFAKVREALWDAVEVYDSMAKPGAVNTWARRWLNGKNRWVATARRARWGEKCASS